VADIFILYKLIPPVNGGELEFCVGSPSKSLWICYIITFRNIYKIRLWLMHLTFWKTSQNTCIISVKVKSQQEIIS